MSREISRVRFENAPSILTIDLEEWFCVCGDDYFGDARRWGRFESRVVALTERLLETLARGGHRATFFVLGWVAREQPALVRAIARAGHEIAFHGMEHRRCFEMTEQQFRSDLRSGRELLEPLAGVRLIGFRAPEWSIRSLEDPALRVLAEEGFLYDSSVTPVPLIGTSGNEPYPSAIAFPDGGRLLEFPPLSGRAYFTTVLLGGSWAFRSVPLRVVRKNADRFREAGAPPTFTFHPWELDSDHPPMTGLPALSRLAHFGSFVNLGKRLDKLLAGGRMHAFNELAGGSGREGREQAG
ncbi:MAG: polysaccharide deacetylase family protein [Thermoanaerobaculia bacterium]